MKRIINLVLGFMLLGYLEGNAQDPCFSSNLTDNPFICGYYGDANGVPNWDWEFEPASGSIPDQTKFCKMWQARTQQGNGLTVMGSPFKNAQTTALDLISQAHDYSRAKGWELLQRNFGCERETSYPYFILYNKYTTVMRVFIYQPGIAPQYSSCLLVIEPTKAPFPATTGMGDAQVTALDKYRNSTSSSGFGRKLMSVTENSGSGNWRVAQFNMGFDPEIQNSLYSGTGFKVTINGIINSTVKAKIKGKSATSTDPLIYNYGFATNNEPVEKDGKNKFETTGEKFVKFSKTIDESREGAYNAATKIVNSLANVADDQSVLKRVKSIAEGVKKITDASSGVGKFISVMGNALGTAGAVLNVVGGVIGLFSGGADEPAPLPTYSVYDMDLEGEITTNIVSYSFIVRMPGALQTDNNNATYYKCPLGIFNVKNTPQADLVTYERNLKGPVLGSPLIKNFVSYRMRNNLEVTYNSGIGLDLVSVQAAIVGEVLADENKNAAYDLVADHTVYYGPYNLMLPDLEAGLLEISRYDPDMKLHTFQTPYVNAECLAGLAFNARAETNVFLRVKAILKKRNDPDNTLIYFVRDYKIETVAGEFDDELRNRHKSFYARSTPVPYSNYPELHNWIEDKTINNVTYNSDVEEVTDRTITTENYVTVPAGRTVLFKTGSEISLEDGFEAEENSEFTAALKISELNLPCGSPVRDAYAYSGNCYNTTASGLRTATDNKPASQVISGETIKVYPIPTDGKLFIEGVKSNSKTTITILDQSGRLVKELRSTSFEGGRIDVDVSSLSNGVYFVKIQTLEQIITRKIVVTK